MLKRLGPRKLTKSKRKAIVSCEKSVKREKPA
jgi:hypothetical protein